MAKMGETRMLSGCRVLDFTQYLAGPTVTRLMAEMGADIIKVELAPMGDPSHAYYAEWEFADEEAFKGGTRSDEFIATGKDAYKRGYPMPQVEFVALG